MPTAKRRLRETQAALEVARVEALFASMPIHIRARLGKPSKIADCLDAPPEYTGIGCAFDENSGQLLRRVVPEEQGANYNRQAKRADDIVWLQEKYADIWCKRGMASKIAMLEGLNVRTVQKYFKSTK